MLPEQAPPAFMGSGKAMAREMLLEMSNRLVEGEVCFNHLEALRLLQEEVACLEAEQRGLALIVRGWGQTLDYGMLEPGALKKLSPWALELYNALSVLKVHKVETDAGFQQVLDMAVNVSAQSFTPSVIFLQSRYTNRELSELDNDSLVDMDDEEHGQFDEEYSVTDEDEDNEEQTENEIMGERYQHQAVHNNDMNEDNDGLEEFLVNSLSQQQVDASQHSSEEDDGQFDYFHDGSDYEDGDDEDGEDDDDDDDEGKGNDDTNNRTRVDYSLSQCKPGEDNSSSEPIIKVSFTTCTGHTWSPEFFEDEENEGKDIDERTNNPDFYRYFEETGTGGSYGTRSKKEDFVFVQSKMLEWATTCRPARISTKRKREAFIVHDECECSVCSQIHGFRVELEWNTLYRFVQSLDPLFNDAPVAPEVVIRYDNHIKNNTDDIFPFVRATRILCFLMAYTCGSSGYAVSPVDFLFGSVLAEGITVFSGVGADEFFADYESDGTVGVD